MKRYFKERRIPFKEANIERDPEVARDIVRNPKQTGMPVIKIRSSWVVGFGKELDNEGRT